MKRTISLLCAAVMLTVSTFGAFSASAVPAKDIAEADIQLAQSEYAYTGSEIKPVVTVKDGGTTLTENSDYSLTYSDNINVTSSAKVTVTGIDGYTGTADKVFKINPADISAAKFRGIKKATVGSGSAYEVTFGNKVLKEGTDYTVSFSNINKVGSHLGTATYTGKGNFKGTKNISINVYPSKVTGIYVKKRNVYNITLAWNAQAGVDGYQIYTCDKDGGNVKHRATVSAAEGTAYSLSQSSDNYFKIRAFSHNNGDVFGDFSDVFLNATNPKKVKLTAVGKSKNGKTLTVKWEKVTCDDYHLQYSTSKNFKSNVKNVYVSKDLKSKNITIPKNKKTYYVRVRARNLYNNNKQAANGEWSNKATTNYSYLYAKHAIHYPNKPARNNNLRIACKAINGTIIYPGEVFSFNKTVGVRSASKGYKKASTFRGANEVIQSYGGGVCQVASTVFNTALVANMQIVERHQHSQRVHYGKLGRDATVYYGSQDFKFRNNTNHPIMIRMWLEDQKVQCAFYTCTAAKHKKVTLKVSKKGKSFTLRRYAGGKVNYTTRSYY